MATLLQSEQLKLNGAGYMDAKMQPVKSLSDLNKITRSHRFIGLTITVIDDGSGLGPRDYWLKDNLSKWVLKKMPFSMNISGDDIENIQ